LRGSRPVTPQSSRASRIPHPMPIFFQSHVEIGPRHPTSHRKASNFGTRGVAELLAGDAPERGAGRNAPRKPYIGVAARDLDSGPKLEQKERRNVVSGFDLDAGPNQ